MIACVIWSPKIALREVRSWQVKMSNAISNIAQPVCCSFLVYTCSIFALSFSNIPYFGPASILALLLQIKIHSSEHEKSNVVQHFLSKL